MDSFHLSDLYYDRGTQELYYGNEFSLTAGNYQLKQKSCFVLSCVCCGCVNELHLLYTQKRDKASLVLIFFALPIGFFIQISSPHNSEKKPRGIAARAWRSLRSCDVQTYINPFEPQQPIEHFCNLMILILMQRVLICKVFLNPRLVFFEF